jgi:hypothetical protein
MEIYKARVPSLSRRIAPIPIRPSLIRYRQAPLRPLTSRQPARKRRNIIPFRLKENIQTIPQRPISIFRLVRRDAKVRSAQGFNSTPRIRNPKCFLLEERRVLSLVGDVIPFDTLIRHLRVKVRRVAQRRGGPNIPDHAHGSVLPRVDGMRVSGCSIFVRIFPPKLHVVVFVVQHGVLCCTSAPTIASYAGVAVEAPPRLYRHPDIFFLARVPCVLLERRVVDGIPDIHRFRTLELFGIVEAGGGGELCKVRVTVEVAFPACLEAGGGRVESL